MSCEHCYASSGPSGSHGSMTGSDWVRVLDQAADLRVEMVEFIGGEPTLYPGLKALIEHALRRGLTVEVFSNLVRVTDELWEVFSRPRVSLVVAGGLRLGRGQGRCHPEWPASVRMAGA